MRVAIIHYWLVSMRGGEKVLESICSLFPEADIFTHVYDPDAVSGIIRKHTIKTTFINSLPFAQSLYKKYVALMPCALEQIDLRDYDLIISSESGPAKGIVPPAHALHICYCHSPMRYVWNMFHDYREHAGFLTRLAMPSVSHYLRNWDTIAATRVDHFIANSQTVADRIAKYYRRSASVIHPPVDVSAFEAASSEITEDYYLMAGELVPYKRPDLAIEAFNASGRRLIVIGGGQMLSRIRKMAGPTVTILGPQPIEMLRHCYSRCRALIFPGEEDFGIVPVEAMACGRPVIAYGRGGATETVVHGVSGLLFDEQSVEAINHAVHKFEQMSFDKVAIKLHARKYSRARFESEFSRFLSRVLGDKFVPRPRFQYEVRTS